MPGHRSLLSRNEAGIQIGPVRVSVLDQIDFPIAFPFLEMLFSADRCLHRTVCLKPDRGVDAIARRKTWDNLALVLEYPLYEVRGYADVQRPVGFACLTVIVL